MTPLDSPTSIWPGTPPTTRGSRPCGPTCPGLPPLLVQAATGDSVLPEARLLVEHARAAGVTANLDLYRSPTHTFHLFWSFLPGAAEALERGGRFLAAAPEAKAAVPSA